jgi:hypothetical protein
MMRGAIAAACAAVILGLLSPGAFACAVAAAARGAAEQQQQHAFASRSVSSATAGRVELPAASRPAGREARSVRPVGDRVTAWRAPSAPAPSRAPPSALL